MLKALFVIIALISPMSVLATANDAEIMQIQLKINKLQLDMDKFQVARIIGDPQTKLKRGLSSRWDYQFGPNSLTVWFGAYGLRNAHGDAFATSHLVAPPEGYVPPVSYDTASDPNRHVEVESQEEQLVSEDDSIFTPILPEQDILKALERWRTARESRNARRYALNYSPEYSSKKRLSHQQWLDEVAKTMAKARFIKVTVNQVDVKFVHSRKVLVSFVQKYQSNRYRDKVKKQLQYEYIASQWLITKETTLAKL